MRTSDHLFRRNRAANPRARGSRRATARTASAGRSRRASATGAQPRPGTRSSSGSTRRPTPRAPQCHARRRRASPPRARALGREAGQARRGHGHLLRAEGLGVAAPPRRRLPPGRADGGEGRRGARAAPRRGGHRAHHREGAGGAAPHPQARGGPGSGAATSARSSRGARPGYTPRKRWLTEEELAKFPRGPPAERPGAGRVRRRDERPPRRARPGPARGRRAVGRGNTSSRSAGRRPRRAPAWCRWSTRGVHLVGIALKHGQGRGLLLRRQANAARTLAAAAARVEVPHVTMNDLRRTFAQWLRRAGGWDDLVAPAMGHVDTKMVDTVYGEARRGRRWGR